MIFITIILSIVILFLSVSILALLKNTISKNDSQIKPGRSKESSQSSSSQILVDTSAIIDGRIADIAAAGFVPGKLLLPRFILQELQNIADSEDSTRRTRGRRGLEMLNLIRENNSIELDIVEEDPADVIEVDHKLVRLAREYHCDILTTDYNLNRVATIEKVKVLNINELANAIKTIVIPGQQMRVKPVQKGKEKGQAVAYLDDGTMIVVENGDKLLGKDIDVEVTRIFQSVAGKMIFATQNNSQAKRIITHKTKPTSAKR